MNYGKNCSLAIAILTASAFNAALAGICYVKPGAGGSGASWSDAADIVTAVATARDGAEVTTIYAAKGVYTLSATLKLNGKVALYGGFAGASMDETPETRDLAANPTILSGDVNGDGVWTRYYPLTGTSDVTVEPIVKNGRINDLALANEYDLYAPASKNHSDNLWRVVTVMENAAATCVLDGVTVTGGGRGPMASNATAEDGFRLDRGSALFVASGATPVIRNCRFVGNTAFVGCVFFNSSTPTFEDNEISFNQSGLYGAFFSSSSTATVRNTAFIGNYRDYNGNGTGAAAVELNRSLVLRGCSFSRNYLRKYRTNSPQEAVCICTEYGDYSGFKVYDCVFFNNACYDTYGAAPAPMIYMYGNQKRITGCLFTNNVTTVVSSAADVKAAGIFYSNDTRESLDGCTVADNSLSVTAVNATSVIAAPYVGESGAGDCNQTLSSCTFTGNGVTVTAPQATDTKIARALALVAPGGPSFIFNSVFAGEVALPDIVISRSNEAATGLRVMNSVFWATGAAANVPRLVTKGTAPATVECSVMHRPELLAESVVLSETTEEDPLLQPLATVVPGKVPVILVGAKLPGIRDTYDVATFVYYGSTCNAYRRTTSDDWQVTFGSGGTKVLTDDALGTARPAGNFTIGAVQRLTDTAENGLTVVYRMDPPNVARLDGKTVQVVAVGETTEAVTGISNSPYYSFRRWRGTDGTEYSTANPVTVTATEAGTLVLTAQFNPSIVCYSFDLGPYATFDADGSTKKDVEMTPDAAVSIPAYTLRDGFAFKGWSPEMPAFVGTANSLFTLQVYRRETELQPGDDIAEAVAEAAGYPGNATVRLGAGTYEPVASFALPSNVKLVGETGAVIRRPQGQWTVKNSSDANASDKGWIEIDGVTFIGGGVYPGVNPARITDCVFTNCVNGESGALCLYTNAVVVGCGFYNGQMALKANGNNQHPIWFWATNCVFRGNWNAPEAGGRSFGAAAALGSCKATTFYNCLFEKNSSSNKGSQYGIVAGASMELTRCRFIDNVCTGDLALVTLAYPATCKLKHTLFLGNRVVGDRGSSSTGHTALIGDGGIGNKEIIGCSFVSNVVDRTEAVTSGSTTTLPCSLFYRQSQYQAFRYNFIEGNVVRATATDPNTTPVCAILTFSAFGNATDYSMEGNTFHDNTAADGLIRLAYGTGGAWIWNSLISGTGAETAPIRHASETVTSVVHYRYSVAPVQNDARIVRDETCKTGPVAFAKRTEEVDGLVIRPVSDVTAARTQPVKWYFTTNGKKMYFNEELKAYRRLDGDCWDSYMTQYTPYTPAADMLGEVPEGRKALAGAFQRRQNQGLVVIFR